ncbi:sodium-dependent acetylcholine transporter domain protein [Trichinella nativa]|uniref:Sodium-dependent acetylcholine transporter domain protein n=1 Tax=Trichinella nativa TaxID=6335 RepID=A0A1Y3ER40_9BILA|nr:sodium-dependent acetylcholine transporter domain protein [Trichinella nativa]
MGKGKKLSAGDPCVRPGALADQLLEEKLAKGRKRSQKDKAIDTEESILDENLSAKILKIAKVQCEDEGELVSKFAADGAPSTQYIQQNKKRIKLKGNLEESEDSGDEEQKFVEDEKVEEMQVDQSCIEAFERFFPSKANDRSELASLIKREVNEKISDIASQCSEGSSLVVRDMDDRLVDMYRKVGKVLSIYRSGSIPKAFKIIPRLPNWEQVLYLTEPDRWTAAAMYQATRLFSSNMPASSSGIPVLHSAAGMLCLAEKEYSLAVSYFLKILMEKKYTLPYIALDGIFNHFMRFINVKKTLPVLWHETLLCFVQNYKSDLSSEQREALLDLIRNQVHYMITPEIRRELHHVIPRDIEDTQRQPLSPAADYEIEYPFEDTINCTEENKIRGNWSSKADSILSSFGFILNFRHLWTIPYYCSIYGGAVFFVPYVAMLLLIAAPFTLMEYSLGQFSSLGCMSVWKVCPLFKGIGISMFLILCLVSIYYNIVIAWAIHYLIASMRPHVAWARCDYPWNTANCSLGYSSVDCINNSSNICVNYENETLLSAISKANFSRQSGFVWPSVEYFYLEILEMSGSVEDFGIMLWQLALYLLAAWLIIFFCLFNHVKSAGKVAYPLTSVPLLILLVLFVKCIIERGGYEGFTAFFQVDWSQLLFYKVWADAAIQAFFSLSCCWGVYITLSSYNRFHNDCFKDVWILFSGEFVCSLFISLVTFCICGFLAGETGTKFNDLIVRGPHLVFVIFSEAVARLPIAPVWAVMYFITVIMIGISTQMFIVLSVVTAMCDEYARRLRRNQRHVLSLCSVLFFSAGLIFCTKAGMYIFEFCEYYVISWSILIVAFMQCMVLSWVYGIDNVMDNIKWMTGYYPPVYLFWKIHLKFLSPFILLALIAHTLISFKPLVYRGYVFPKWMNYAGWAVSFMPLIIVLITLTVKFIQQEGLFVKRLRDLMIPEDDWGPALAVHRAEEFPLQIPEAKEPFRSDGFFSHQLEANSSNDDNQLSEDSYIGRLDRVDRETAI